MVRIPISRDVQDSRPGIPRNRTPQALRRFPLRRPPNRRNVHKAPRRRFRQRKRRPRRRLHPIPAILLLNDRQLPQRTLEVAKQIRGQARQRPGLQRWRNHLERDRPVARPRRPRRGLCAEHRSSAGYLPRGEEEERRSALLRALPTHECRQQRRYLSG